MSNPNFSEFPVRNSLAGGPGQPAPTGVRAKSTPKMNIKPGPAGGLPGKSQPKSRSNGVPIGGKFILKPEGIQ